MANVVVYSKANCPQCVKVKNELALRGVEFNEIRIDLPLNIDIREGLLAKGHRSVPIIYKDDVHIADYTTLTNEIV